jgi:aspartate/methionine/tyrosine aminotransferase
MIRVADDAIAACVGTKEFVASLPGYLALREPTRDTVLYPAVSYPTYEMGARLASLRSVPVPVINGQLDLDAISSSDADRALCLWVNSPSNPTGRVEDLARCASWGRERGVLVISDECYAEFTWTDRPRSILEEGLEGVLAVHSISKRSNLAGVRAGFYLGDREVVKHLALVRQHAGLMVAGPIQEAVAATYGDDEHVDEQRTRYSERLALMRTALEHAGLEVDVCEGSFYLWASDGRSGFDTAADLARRSGLIVSPGEFYGVDSDHHVRVAVVQPTERLRVVADRLSEL